MTKKKQNNNPKEQKQNNTTQEINTTKITTLLEQYLQFRRIPRFQNHRNKITIHQEQDKTTITIQRPLEPLTPREQNTILNKTTKTETLTDGLKYTVYTTKYTPEELETLIKNISG